jgi:DNA-binding CsgD family transcriptional regulator
VIPDIALLADTGHRVVVFSQFAERNVVLAGDDRPDRPALSPREITALLLWFSSMSKIAVAHRMGVSPHTVDMFIRPARLKYAQANRLAHAKADLLARTIEDGLVRPEEVTGDWN